MLSEPGFGEEEEELDLFVGNVLEEIKGSELRVVCDLVCSRVLERVVRMGAAARVRAVFRSVLALLEPMLDNRYASHVLETLLVRAAALVRPDEEADVEALGDCEAEVPEETTLLSMVGYVCKTVQMDPGRYITSTYASHVVRTLVSVLAGIPTTDSSRSKASKAYRSAAKIDVGWGGGAARVRPAAELPGYFGTSLGELADGISKLGQFGQMLVHATASPVVQTLLDALKARDPVRCAALCHRVLESPGGGLGGLLKQRVGSHVAEKVLGLCTDETFFQAYQAHFRGRLKELALCPMANFVVAKLLEHTRTAQEASAMAAELEPVLESVLAANHPSVAIQLAEAAARHKVRQRSVLAALHAAFHISSPEDVKRAGRLVLAMATVDRAAELEAEAAAQGGAAPASVLPIDAHGARLVAALLKFGPEQAQPLVACFAKPATVSDAELLELALHVVGSRVLESALSADVPAKHKGRLLRRFKGHFAKCALAPRLGRPWAHHAPPQAGLRQVRKPRAGQMLGCGGRGHQGLDRR